MRQEKAATQYKPSAARDANGNWYKVKDHEVREAGIGISSNAQQSPPIPPSHWTRAQDERDLPSMVQGMHQTPPEARDIGVHQARMG